jgi:hypothetical protein
MSEKIFNPYSGRMVKKDGPKGKEIQVLHSKVPSFVKAWSMNDLRERMIHIGIDDIKLDKKNMQLVYYLELQHITKNDLKLIKRTQVNEDGSKTVSMVNNNLITKFPKTNLKPCPPGKVRNPDTKRCVKVKTPKPCPPGKVRNPKTGRCKKGQS